MNNYILHSETAFWASCYSERSALFGIILIILFYSRRLRISMDNVCLNNARISTHIRRLREKHTTFERESHPTPVVCDTYLFVCTSARVSVQRCVWCTLRAQVARVGWQSAVSAPARDGPSPSAAPPPRPRASRVVSISIAQPAPCVSTARVWSRGPSRGSFSLRSAERSCAPGDTGKHAARRGRPRHRGPPNGL